VVNRPPLKSISAFVRLLLMTFDSSSVTEQFAQHVEIAQYDCPGDVQFNRRNQPTIEE
jgi:hypothetical protein